ncbi:MAG: S1C family serine protease [Candidatus Promineifilaceae bacterium]
MSPLPIKPIFLFIALIVLSVAACDQIPNLNPPQTPVVDQDAIVEAVVATITARSPVPTRVAEEPTPVPINSNAQSLSVVPDLQDRLVEVYEHINPSVVHIFVFDEIEGTALPLGTGSGFVFDNDGYVVTNNHVIAEGDRFEVVFADGSRRDAELIGSDIDSDLGVLKVDGLPSGVKPVALGDSRDLHVGQFVVAIGNPFGEAGSMSVGIVSGLGRTLESQRIAEGGGRYSLPEVIQTDAAINPGNSGGPLLDLTGEVVGVNSAISTRTGTNSGVGFSIPVNAVRQIVPFLIKDGAYTYPYMGIRMLSLNLELQEQLDVPQATGAYVTETTENSPALEAGLIGENGPGGDLIIAVDGHPVITSDDLIAYLVFETVVGDTIELTVIRDGEEIVVPLTLGVRP